MAQKDNAQKDNLPWLLMPCVLLTLCSVTLLVPRHSAQAAPTAASASKPVSAAKPVFKTASAETYDDGDGDELLEHWGDPKYSREERVQMAGGAIGFLLLFGCAWGKRTAKQLRTQFQPHAELRTQSEEFEELRKAA
jgi:hypothetical protein